MCGCRGCTIWIYVKTMSYYRFFKQNLQLHTYLHQVTSTSARAEGQFPYQSISSMSLLRHITVSST